MSLIHILTNSETSLLFLKQAQSNNPWYCVPCLSFLVTLTLSVAFVCLYASQVTVQTTKVC